MKKLLVIAGAAAGAALIARRAAAHYGQFDFQRMIDRMPENALAEMDVPEHPARFGRTPSRILELLSTEPARCREDKRSDSGLTARRQALAKTRRVPGKPFNERTPRSVITIPAARALSGGFLRDQHVAGAGRARKTGADMDVDSGALLVRFPTGGPGVDTRPQLEPESPPRPPEGPTRTGLRPIQLPRSTQASRSPKSRAGLFTG